MIRRPVTLGGRRYAPAPEPFSEEQRAFLVLAMLDADVPRLAVAHGRRRWFERVRVHDVPMLPVLAAVIVPEREAWTLAHAHETAVHLAGLRDRRDHKVVFRMCGEVLDRFATGSAGALMREAAEITLTS
jgi:hypothetical protein